MKGKIFKNAGWIVGCKIVKAILTFLVTMITARIMGPSKYGLISYAASLVIFFTPIMKLGFDSTLVYELVNNPKDEGKILGSSIVLNLISSMFCILSIFVFVFFFNSGEKDTLIVCSLYSILLIFQAFEMIQYWFQAKLLSKFSAISMLISYIIISIIQVLLLVFIKNLYLFAFSYTIDFLIISILLCFFYKKNGGQKLSFSKLIAKKMFSKSKYYIISNLMVTIFAQTDKIMIKKMIDNSAVGYYSAATTCAVMISFVFAALLDSYRPVIFENKKKSDQKFHESLIELYSIVIYCSLAVCVLMTVFSPLIVNIMYGSSYAPTILALRIVVWYTTFSYLGSVRNIWIISENKQNFLWIINMLGVIMNILLNYFLIPIYGINGAAIASVITQFFTNVIVSYIITPIRFNNYLIIQSLNIKKVLNKLKG